MASLHPTLLKVTERVIARSHPTRTAYLERIAAAQGRFPARGALSCANLAHGFAGLEGNDKFVIKAIREPNIGIVSSYNEMLSAHAPYKDFPDIIKAAARENGGVAQFAGGVPAMCDGVTQGKPGMELSLFSREAIAMGTAIALTHNMFDAALCLGICDKIVPGLLIGALQFGHLPTIFVPAGPMTSGLSNDDKAKIRQQFATGQVGRDALLESESAAYHGHGTCTFYGTANSNQMLMEVMGLHLPGSAFVHPHTPLRDALTGRRRAPRARPDRRARQLHADRPRRRREGHRQRHRRAAGHRRLDQPHHAPGGDRARGRHPDRLGRFRRAVGGGAAAGAHLPERQGRREPLPGGRRRGLPGAQPARRRPAARGREDRGRQGPRALHLRAEAARRQARRGCRAWPRAAMPRCCARSASRSPPTAACA